MPFIRQNIMKEKNKSIIYFIPWWITFPSSAKKSFFIYRWY